MSENCTECKYEHPECPVCEEPDESRKELVRCKTHRVIFICGPLEKECKKCEELGFEYSSGTGCTIFKYKDVSYDPYDDELERPLKNNFIKN
jgi:hypothetical protein